MKMIRRYALMLAGWLLSTGLQAQNVRAISVAQGASYTDHLSLNMDSKDMDLMVKFVFDEDANTLTVSLISYRTIFVFWDRVRMKPLVRGRRIRPELLPYVVNYEPNDRYLITKLFKSTVPRPRKKFYFQRWMDYEGLQPIPQEYKMVNDYISQTFDILNKRSLVTFRLHDIFLMDKTEKKKYNLYEIPFGRDVNIEYQVTIERNPCFGFGEEVASAQKALEGVKGGYKTLKKNYGNGKVGSEEALKVFDDLKRNLLEQFPAKQQSSPCQDMQTAYDEYNQYVDSISQIKCTLESFGGTGTAASAEISAEGTKIIASKARFIDNLVSRWLVSTDPTERRDIVRRIQSQIDDVNELIGDRSGNTPQQRQAIEMFRAAESYFQKTCMKR